MCGIVYDIVCGIVDVLCSIVWRCERPFVVLCVVLRVFLWIYCVTLYVAFRELFCSIVCGISSVIFLNCVCVVFIVWHCVYCLVLRGFYVFTVELCVVLGVLCVVFCVLLCAIL